MGKQQPGVTDQIYFTTSIRALIWCRNASIQCHNLTRSDPRATVKFHASKIRKTLNQCGLFGKPPLSKNSIAVQLRLAKLHLNVPQDVKNNVIWTDKTKVEMFGQNVRHHISPHNSG